jgi:chemotaxis protein MotB
LKDAQRYRFDPGKDEDSQGWLITYADTMTLLLCFFVLMMGISQVNFDSYEQIKKEVATSFGGKYEDPYAKLSDSIEELITVENLGKDIKIVSKGSGVTLIFQGQMLFDSGKADIKPEALPILENITNIIKDHSGSLFMVIEGHTDNVPIRTERFPSNWELSAGRAARIVREFESFGIERKKMLAVGAGDTRPTVSNFYEDGSYNIDNQALNRRVVLRLTKDELIKKNPEEIINYESDEYIKSIQGALK